MGTMPCITGRGQRGSCRGHGVETEQAWPHAVSGQVTRRAPAADDLGARADACGGVEDGRVLSPTGSRWWLHGLSSFRHYG